MQRIRSLVRTIVLAALVLGAAALTGPALFAQEAAKAPELPAKTTPSPALDKRALAAHLKPMTKDQVAAEAKAWVAEFTKKAESIRDVELGADQSSLPQLIDERTGITDRIEMILAAWKARSGDPAAIKDYEKYLSAASGISIDYKNIWPVITGWLTSENGGIKWGANLAFFLLTLFVFKILAGFAAQVMLKAVGRMKKSSDLLRKFCVNFARKFTSFLGLIVALSVLGVDVTPFLAVLGAAGFIIGFALQGTLNNFASGIMILIYRPFDVGNVITAAGVTGKVEAMTMSSTTIKTPDNQVIIVPNGSIWGGIITNVTGSATRRVDLKFSIGYSDDIGKAQAILEDLVAKHEKILKDPAPVIKVHELGTSSVDFVCRPWSKTSDYWEVYWDLTRSVKERFDAEGVSIPFPQTDVHLHQVVAS